VTERLLVEGGTVITLDRQLGELARGDVLVEDGVIVAVAPSIECEDCVRLDAHEMAVLPGLVDSHRHLWYTALRGDSMDHVHGSLRADLWPRMALRYTPEDVLNCARAGVVECLDAGITCVLDWCHIVNTPEHAVAAVDALRSLPIRAVFAYGISMRHKLIEAEQGPQQPVDWTAARALRESSVAVGGKLLSMALALQGPEATNWENTVSDVAAAREIGIPMTMHVGIPQGPAPKLGVKRLHDAGLLGPDMNFVHCNALTDEEIDHIAASGATVTITPMAELALGMGVPPVGRFRRAGVPAALGADAVCSASGDLFDEARTALLSDRLLTAQAVHAQGKAVSAGDPFGITTSEALASITVDGARACWQLDAAGSLTPGKSADLIMLRTRDPNLAPTGDSVATIVGCAHSGNVDTVIVAGRIVKRHGRLQGLELDSISAGLAATRERLSAR
jgi:5-methylthioadenosine/S-adenosylhomocysteine deaminase